MALFGNRYWEKEDDYDPIAVERLNKKAMADKTELLRLIRLYGQRRKKDPIQAAELYADIVRRVERL